MRVITVILLTLMSLSSYSQKSTDTGLYYSLSEALKTPDKVVRLYLSNKKLRFIPKGVFKFKNLEYLYLNDNDIVIIDNQIGSLKKLKFLDLSNNKIEFIPKVLENCKFLEGIYLKNNSITQIPKTLHLNQLKIFVLQGNKIVNLYLDLLLLPKVEVLNVSYNKLNHCTLLNASESNLQFLMLQTNYLKEFEVCDLIKGKVINLTNNKISNFPDCLILNSNLERLLLGRNSISRVPKEICTTRISFIDIGEMPILNYMDFDKCKNINTGTVDQKEYVEN